MSVTAFRVFVAPPRAARQQAMTAPAGTAGVVWDSTEHITAAPPTQSGDPEPEPGTAPEEDEGETPGAGVVVLEIAEMETQMVRIYATVAATALPSPDHYIDVQRVTRLVYRHPVTGQLYEPVMPWPGDGGVVPS